MKQTRPPDPRSPEVLAIGLIQEAESFRRAALAVDAEVSRPLPRVSMPALYLLCHAMELTLKAFLASHGTPARALMRPDLRHNLPALHRLAVEAGFTAPDAAFAELVEWLGPYHEDHVFRYRPPGGQVVSLPLAKEATDRLEPVIAWVEKVVRARYLAAKDKAR